MGHVTWIHPQQASVYFTKSDTHAYTLNYEIVEIGPVGNANLTPAGQAIFDAYTLDSRGPVVTFPSVVVAQRDWRVPEDLRLEPGEKPVALADLKLFHTQSPEPSSLHDISSEDFVKQIALARETRPKQIETMIRKLREEMLFSAKYRDPLDARADLAILKQVVPADRTSPTSRKSIPSSYQRTSTWFLGGG